ncbi:hypothetical protein FM106_03210 [Brachybacterium faecium]|nr:hypothetical protein FM106_03210 [Brachybacterium faecium]
MESSLSAVRKFSYYLTNLTLLKITGSYEKDALFLRIIEHITT